MGTATGRITVLIPAHDEERDIAAAIGSVRAQTRPVDRIVVIADNCADGTAAAAAASGAEVVTTTGNRHRKAGALNQVLDGLLGGARDDDLVLVMDADSHLDPGFVTAALALLTGPGGGAYGGVGGTFRGRPVSDPALRRAGLGRWVESVQCNEYARYARDVHRKRGRVLVLTGTATLFRITALRAVVAARRAGRLPAAPGAAHVYDTAVLTEDNELTLALLHLGWRVRSPDGCTLTTEVMPTWRTLYRQRLRWKRGALENLRQYGLTRITAKYWGYQLATLAGIVVTACYLASLVLAAAATHDVRLHAVWLVVTGIFVAERVVTVRRRGWRWALMAALLLPEMVFDVFLQATHAKALLDTLTRRAAAW
ncbi:MAG TPA: glycosyltransferase family 2 protein [Streptosporangiaceae bacterium]|jgi:cellulose synthase/poly-beta-1,6-N-acetylglucosamine synthase-like glycosyltransferase